MRVIRPFFLINLLLLLLSGSLFPQSFSWPESAVYDAPNDRYLISNTGSGDIISVPRTNVNNLSFFCQGAVTGYPSMRGVIIVGNTLWGACSAADASQVLVGFDFAGNITDTITITEGSFINDVTYDWDNDLIYLSDDNNIYRVNHTALTYGVYLVNAQANGLLYDGNNRLIFTDDSPQSGSRISVINLTSGVVSNLYENQNISSLDGLTVDNQGNYYVSYWNSNNGHGIIKYDSEFITGNVLPFFNEGGAGYADIYYDLTNDQIVVPKMMLGEVGFVQPNNLVKTGDEKSIPLKICLNQNYPNPFNPNTSINYEVTKESLVNITIYDLLGAEIIQIVNQIEQPGIKTITWDGRDSMANIVNGGVYLYKLTVGNYTETKKMVFLK